MLFGSSSRVTVLIAKTVSIVVGGITSWTVLRQFLPYMSQSINAITT